MYKVIKLFTDLQDYSHKYNVGDTFPRKGLDVSKERLEELSTDKNRRGIPLIEEITRKKAEEKPEANKESIIPETEEKPKKRSKKKNDAGADS